MRRVDYSYPGGLPLSQDVLDWMQQGYGEVLKGMCMRGYPDEIVAISGCVYDGTANTVSSGWLFDGDEPVYFPGGDLTAAATNMIKLQTTTTTLVYGTGAVNPTYVNKQYVLDASGLIDVRNIKRFGITSESVLSIPVATTEVVGEIHLMANLAARQIYIKADLLVQESNLVTDGQTVQLIDHATIAGDVIGKLIPGGNVYFTGMLNTIGTGSGGVPTDTGGHPFYNINFKFISTGLYGWFKQTGGTDYHVYINSIIPLD